MITLKVHKKKFYKSFVCIMIIICTLTVGCKASSEALREVNVHDLVNEGDFLNNIYYLDGESEPYTGKATDYYESGQLSELYHLKDGLLHGQYAIYYEEGQVESEGTYTDGNEVGTFTEYYVDGSLMMVSNYKEGLLHGKMINYYENGQIESEGTYEDGNLNGKTTWYYESGVVKKEASYIDSEFHGDYIEYTENGEIELKETYDNGTLINK